MSTSGGGILLFLLIAIALPAATIGLAYLLRGRAPARRGQGEDRAAAPSPLPAWLPFSIASFAAALILAVLGVAVVAVIVWAVALHLLDHEYAAAELILFLALIAAGAGYCWVQGVVRATG